MDDFEDLLDTSTDEVRELLLTADRLIHHLHPDVDRTTWLRQRVVGYGVGPRKMTQHYSYLSAFGAHINLGFNHGARLPDPAALLLGEGNEYRSIRIVDPSQLHDPAITDLLRAARDEGAGAAANRKPDRRRGIRSE